MINILKDGIKRRSDERGEGMSVGVLKGKKKMTASSREDALKLGGVVV